VAVLSVRITFDSNVLVYAAADSDPVKHEIAKTIIGRAGAADAFLTLQSLAEAFHVLTRKIKVDYDGARRFVDRLARTFPIEAAGPVCFRRGTQIYAEYRLQFWDAMLCATAERADCDILVTEDLQDGRVLGRMVFLNPFGPSLPPQLDAALAPLPET
jgi:predicted nucleic acid-binding protein